MTPMTERYREYGRKGLKTYPIESLNAAPRNARAVGVEGFVVQGDGEARRAVGQGHGGVGREGG